MGVVGVEVCGEVPRGKEEVEEDDDEPAEVDGTAAEEEAARLQVGGQQKRNVVRLSNQSCLKRVVSGADLWWGWWHCTGVPCPPGCVPLVVLPRAGLLP